MAFPCFARDKVFSRSQDRNAHIKQKKDSEHQAYIRNQAQELTARFSRTIEDAACGLTDVASLHPAAEDPVVQFHDLDQDDLPFSRDMNVDVEDADPLLDLEGSIMSSSEKPVEDSEDEMESDFLATAFADTGLCLDENEATFDFLPAPGLDQVEEGEDGPGPTAAASQQSPLGRLLDDDDGEQHTWNWHDSAGKIYGYRQTAYQRWNEISSGDGEKGREQYRPFSSRLDWEVAQWAVKNKIKQGALNRLLQIPQVKS